MNLKSDLFFVAYRENKNGSLLYEDINNLSDFRIIKSPHFCWAADPFPCVYKGKRYIFAEIALTINGKGRIGVICLDDKKPKWRIVSKEKFHMSFPNVVSINGSFYIMPETFKDGCLALYRLDEKFHMSKYQILNTVDFCVDTVFIKDSFDYFFSYESSNYLSENYELVWRQKSDSSLIASLHDDQHVLRPAGNIFLNHNKLVLPTQDCRNIYGGGIIFNELLINKTEKRFAVNGIFEITAKDIKQQMKIKNAVGCHTYNFCENIETIDILIRKFSFLGLLFKILNRMKRD